MDEPTVDEIVTWFNAWLKEPISSRERVIISEVVNHVQKHPQDVFKAVADRARWDAMGMRPFNGN